MYRCSLLFTWRFDSLNVKVHTLLFFFSFAQIRIFHSQIIHCVVLWCRFSAIWKISHFSSIYYHLFLLCEYYTWIWIMCIDQKIRIKFHCFSPVTGNKKKSIRTLWPFYVLVAAWFVTRRRRRGQIFCLGVILNDFYLFWKNKYKNKCDNLLWYKTLAQLTPEQNVVIFN